MSAQVIVLDDIGSLERIFKREYGSKKFVISCFLEDKYEAVASYTSDELNDMELCYLIDSLKEMRAALARGEV